MRVEMCNVVINTNNRNNIINNFNFLAIPVQEIQSGDRWTDIQTVDPY